MNIEQVRWDAGAPAGFKMDARPVGSGASLREMIRNIDNYFAIWAYSERLEKLVLLLYVIL